MLKYIDQSITRSVQHKFRPCNTRKTSNPRPSSHLFQAADVNRSLFFSVWTVSHWQRLAGEQKTGRREEDEGEQREGAGGPGAKSIQ